MTESPGRVLALDAGSKRIGLALSDEMRIIAQPRGYIEAAGREAVLRKLAELIENERVTEVVIGLPKRLDGSHGPMAEEAKALGAVLRERAGVKVRFWDERYSTHAAERALLEADVSRKKRKKVIDQTAAAWILQGYLDRGAGR